ncbi:acyltransferase family protein [Acidovorax sp.]|uniref:acyltransferase family protein n=1 Tax=Acidovorax sp. TaxID=1872122 RepID=UPI0025C2380E|nr:acyltransferase family protein [Acidovorax sp.]
MSAPVYRPDIDGLRALAVLSVLVHHVDAPLLSGGFLGVDIFFVISGYLISLIVFRELALGDFSFAHFYARRIRRLFPALIAVFLACLVFGAYALFADEYQRLGRHALVAISFLLNFLLMREAGYFDVVSSAKPLLHLWSLSVEEQFYLVWPVLLVLAARVRLKASLLLGVAVVGSFLFALHLGETRLDALYFHPLARFWELLFGAGLAYTHHRFGVDVLPARMDQVWVRHLLSLAGLITVCAAMFTFDGKTPHPGVSALLPLLGAVALIASGPVAIGNRLLTFKPMVWVGLISYPLYLWHWPVLSYLRIMESGAPSPLMLWSGAGAAVLLAWATYRFIECPIRQAPQDRAAVTALVSGMALLLVVAGVVWQTGGLPGRDSVRHAVDAAAMMNREPATDEPCRRGFAPNAAPVYCRLHASPDRIVAVVGDSHAHALYPGIAEKATAWGYGAILLANSGCPPLSGTTWGRNEPEKTACAAAIEKILRAVEQDGRIAAVVLATRGPQYIDGTGFGPVEAHYNYPPLAAWGPGSAGGDGDDPAEVFARGLGDTVQRLGRKKVPLVYLLQVPELGVPAHNCIDRPLTVTGRHSGCVVARSVYDDRMRLYRQHVARVAAQVPALGVVDPLPVFCDAAQCAGIRDGRLLYADDNHISLVGAGKLAPLVFDELQTQGLKQGALAP